MGGINCPPPKIISDASPEIRVDYIKSLAEYCDNLFKGISEFYIGQDAIEQAVLRNKIDVSNIAFALQDSQKSFDRAFLSLGQVASLRQNLGGEKIDFNSQLESLRLLSNDLSVSIQRFVLIDFSDNLIQDDLWDDQTLTSHFAVVAKTIARISSWQAEFALSNERVFA